MPLGMGGGNENRGEAGFGEGATFGEDGPGSVEAKASHHRRRHEPPTQEMLESALSSSSSAAAPPRSEGKEEEDEEEGLQWDALDSSANELSPNGEPSPNGPPRLLLPIREEEDGDTRGGMVGPSLGGGPFGEESAMFASPLKDGDVLGVGIDHGAHKVGLPYTHLYIDRPIQATTWNEIAYTSPPSFPP